VPRSMPSFGEKKLIGVALVYAFARFFTNQKWRPKKRLIHFSTSPAFAYISFMLCSIHSLLS